MRVLIVIPVRLMSSRLPRKALQLVGRKPILQWVVEEVQAMGLPGQVVVAADTVEVVAWAKSWGVAAELVTGGAIEPRNGTERVARLLQAFPSYLEHVDVVVNVQADQLGLTPGVVRGAVARVLEAGDSVGTVVAAEKLCLGHRHTCVEALVDATGACLSFWRRWDHAGRVVWTPPTISIGRHVGVYAYSPTTLRKWVDLPCVPAEVQSGLEQLRPLIAGMSIGASWLGVPPPHAIDTPEDLAHVRRLAARKARELV